MVAIARALFLIAISLGSSYALSSAGFKPWTHFGVRPLAMGNAYVAVADDYNALFYNPAGLARLDSWSGELVNPTLEVSRNTYKFTNDLLSVVGGGASDTTEILELVEENTGQSHYIGLKLTPHLVFPNFGIGIGIDVPVSLRFNRYPSVNLDLGPRVTIPIGFAMNFLENRLSIGTNFKVRAKGGVDHEFTIQDLNSFQDSEALDEFVEGGIGYGVDFGLLFTPMEPMEPTIGLSITDLGGTPYEQKDIGGVASGKPSPELPSVNLGISLKPISTGNSFLRTSLDMHSINQPFSFSKKLNFGLEYALGSIFKIQTGLHQGYFSGGFQIDLPILLAIRFATYGAELGTSAGTIEDRRYVLQIKLLI